jgi:hypothetical protein
MAKNFAVKGNVVTLEHEDYRGDKLNPQQIMLDLVIGEVFSFSTVLLKSKTNKLMVGIVDRRL